jgi:hypothetical protein
MSTHHKDFKKHMWMMNNFRNHFWMWICFNLSPILKKNRGTKYSHLVGPIWTPSPLTQLVDYMYSYCRNLNLGLATKARACKGAGQERSMGLTSHALGSAKECEGMNPHTPKWTLILRICRNPTLAKCGVKPNTWKKWRFGVLRDSRMFRARQQGSKHLALRCSWCHWKGLEA